MRHPKSVNISLNATAAARARLAGPCCEKCRALEIGPRGGVGCANGRILDATNCPDFRDASRQRDYFPNFDHR